MIIARDGFTEEEVIDALHAVNRTVDFEYELLDEGNALIRRLTNVHSSGNRVSQNMLAQIKRVAQFTLVEDGQPINYLKDRIRPIMKIKSGTQWIKFPLGVFLLSAPTRITEGQRVLRQIDAYDLTQILVDDKVTTEYEIQEGYNIKEAVIEVLENADVYYYNIDDTDKVVPRTLIYDIGTPKIKIINDLLSMINFTPIHVDENGVFTSRLYIPPVDRPTDYFYRTDKDSVIYSDAEEELDLFEVPNVFVVVRTNEEEPPLSSTVINDDPNSPVSTINRGRSIVDFREIDDIADQEALDAYVERIAFEAQLKYGRIRFNSALMPIHGYSDVVQFDFGSLGISGKYLELSWEMDLTVNGVMSHELRQVVSL